jgi:hypothetical protein
MVNTEAQFEQINTNRNICPLEFMGYPIIASLAEYRNRLFVSKNLVDILEFYRSFESNEEVLEWMRERPKGACFLHEIEGDKEIVVVIPTADFNGNYAKNCRETIFKKLQIIFVESGEIGDPFFNFAHSVNIGISKALTYNPKWVIVSNDDMFQLDPIEKLVSEIRKINENDIDAIFITESPHHSVVSELAEPRFIRKFFHWLYPNKVFRYLINLEDKFNVKYLSVSKSSLFGLIFFKKGYRFIQGMDFFVISAKYSMINEGNLFDETFINTYEDVDLSLRLSFNAHRIATVDFRIGDYYGKSLGKVRDRMLRDLTGEIYMNYKIANEFAKYLDSPA